MTSINATDHSDCDGEINFCGIFESRPSKFIAVAFSIILLAVNLVIWFGAIWFERFGSDHKRTLVNKLFTSMAWTAMSAFVVSGTDNVRYLFGPFPAGVCSIQMFLKNVFKTQALIFFDAIVIVRFVVTFFKIF